MTDQDKNKSVYHQRQSRQMCAMHALNNLFQETRFNKQILDDICKQLAPDHMINPHRSLLGLGNYDVNILGAALGTCDMEALWFDKRKDISRVDLEQVFGFILNIPTDVQLGFISLPFSNKHWIAVRQIDGLFYNLDSKLDHPQVIGADCDLFTFLQQAARTKNKEILIVVKSGIDLQDIGLRSEQT